MSQKFISKLIMCLFSACLSVHAMENNGSLTAEQDLSKFQRSVNRPHFKTCWQTLAMSSIDKFKLYKKLVVSTENIANEVLSILKRCETKRYLSKHAETSLEEISGEIFDFIESRLGDEEEIPFVNQEQFVESESLKKRAQLYLARKRKGTDQAGHTHWDLYRVTGRPLKNRTRQNDPLDNDEVTIEEVFLDCKKGEPFGLMLRNLSEEPLEMRMERKDTLVSTQEVLPGEKMTPLFGRSNHEQELFSLCAYQMPMGLSTARNRNTDVNCHIGTRVYECVVTCRLNEPGESPDRN